MNLLVDADILIFRLCWSHEKTIDWGDGITSVDMNPGLAKRRFASMVERYRNICHCDSVMMCLTSKNNFRFDVYPEYKANREYEKKELFPIMLEWLEERYHCVRMPRIEADDVMGILTTKEPGQHVIASIDKDLDQIPGKHFNWNKNKKYEVNSLKADRLFYQQIMMGDPTDNYYGIKGVGPVKAKKLLDDTPKHYRWQAIVGLFEDNGMTEEDALQMARVARILRVEDYNFETKEPILWTPKEMSNGEC